MLTKSINFSFVHFAIYCCSVGSFQSETRAPNSTIRYVPYDIPFWYLWFRIILYEDIEKESNVRELWSESNIERTLWWIVKMRKSILFKILNTNICALITCLWNDNKLTEKKKQQQQQIKIQSGKDEMQLFCILTRLHIRTSEWQ